MTQTAGSPDARWRYAFEADDPIDRLALAGLARGDPEIPESAGALIKIGRGWTVRSRDQGPRIEGKAQCIEFLTAHAADLFADLLSGIRRYNKTTLVVRALVYLSMSEPAFEQKYGHT